MAGRGSSQGLSPEPLPTGSEVASLCPGLEAACLRADFLGSVCLGHMPTSLLWLVRGGARGWQAGMRVPLLADLSWLFWALVATFILSPSVSGTLEEAAEEVAKEFKKCRLLESGPVGHLMRPGQKWGGRQDLA